MINEQNTVGQRIKAAREKADLTQSDLANLLGYSSPTAVSLIEANERSVKVETLEKVAEVLHADVNYLATGKTEQRTSVKTALRADDNFNAEDVKQIEGFIDFLVAKKNAENGRRPSNKG